MSSKPIRVQLPGGAIYAPAFAEAVSKICARSGLATKTTRAFTALVSQSIETLNSGDSTSITLEMHVHDKTMAGTVVGKGCTTATKRLVSKLEKTGASRAQSFALKQTKSALTISFET